MVNLQLHFVIGGRLSYLGHGLAVILGFIGAKPHVEALHGSHIEEIKRGAPHIGIATSLGFIVLTLAVPAVASLLRSRNRKAAGTASRKVPLPPNR
ncbi:hypothetical protein GCM10009854_47170 [Saccharopolyspora halophila]|uniref:Uncharacterized protein n=1 Tax=Saccharopolyspora halophila TaxID=405551 RepID=A0ABP5TUM1_9PSEU